MIRFLLVIDDGTSKKIIEKLVRDLEIENKVIFTGKIDI